MVKFGSYLQRIEKDAPPALKGHFINYKQLKKKLKKERRWDNLSDAEKDFFKTLQVEVEVVNRYAHGAEVTCNTLQTGVKGVSR